MNSCEDASFDLFSRPLTEVGLQQFQDEQILPTTGLSPNSTTIEFNINGDGSEYTSLAEARLFLRVKVVTTDGSDFADDKVSLVKFWPHALFQQCDMFLNGTLVTNASGMYNYLSYISSQLSFTQGVKDTQLSVLEHSSTWKVKSSNPEAEAFIRLHLPLCNQSRLLPNGMRIQLRFMRAPDEFIIMKKPADTVNYKVELQHVSLFVRRIMPTPGLLLEHSSIMSKMNCVFPIVRIWPRFFTLQKGIREFDLPNVIQGQLPCRVLVGLVKTTAFSGTSTEDPFKFENFKLEAISLQCNGRSLPAVPLTADFDKDRYSRLYHSFIDTIQGPCADSDSLGINGEQYKTENCFIGFSLARALDGQQSSLPPRESGYLNAKLRFANTLAENINAIFFLEFNNLLEIDSARNIYIDFAA